MFATVICTVWEPRTNDAVLLMDESDQKTLTSVHLNGMDKRRVLSFNLEAFLFY